MNRCPSDAIPSIRISTIGIEHHEQFLATRLFQQTAKFVIPFACDTARINYYVSIVISKMGLTLGNINSHV